MKPAKKAAYLRYSKKEVRLARRRIHERTTEFRDKYRFRAGVEATMSEYDRRTGAKKLRVRGLEAVTFAAVLKAAGLNIRRAAASQKWAKALETLSLGLIWNLIWFVVHVTEQIRSRFATVTTWITQNGPADPADHEMAA